MKEKPGWWVGVAQNVGDAMTVKILTEDTKKIIIRSVIRPAKNDRFQNKRVQFEPSPDAPDEDAECGMLTYRPRRLKIDQGLSKRKKSKQLRRQQCRPASMLPPATSTLADWTVPNPSGEDLSSPPTPGPIRTPLIVGKYSGENHEALEHVPDDSAVPSTDDASTPDPINNLEVDTEPALTSRRSHRQRRPVDRLTLTTKAMSQPGFLQSAQKGIVLGLGISLLDTFQVFPSKEAHLQGSPPPINAHPERTTVGVLTTSEARRLRELLDLDLLNVSINPEPDDNAWQCIAVTRHKVRNGDPMDIHTKVKVVWAGGDES
jgi:hypothetical protein